jgi:hypothetical protein
VTGTLEWWPDYGRGPLWQPAGLGGTHVEPASLGLESDLADRLAKWNAEYDDDKLPNEGGGDDSWISQGIDLLAEVRHQLMGRYRVVVREPW